MRTTRILLAAAAVATAALVMTACTGGGSTNPSSSTGGDIDTDATVNVGLYLAPDNLDIRNTSGAALEQALISNVYQGLVGLDPKGQIVDVLAKSHTISDDGLTYDFTLNDGVKFSDGTALTAEIAAASLNANLNGKFTAITVPKGIKSITAKDDSTVEITLDKPNIELLYTLTGRFGLIFNPDSTADYKTTSDGTGPFTVSGFQPNQSLTLKRNDSYWGDKAKVASVVFHYFGDQRDTATSAALNGDLDVLTPVDANLASQFDGSDFTLTSLTSTDKYTLGFNNKQAPLDDVNVRTAIREAIDHKALVDAYGGDGAASLLGGPIPQGDPGYEDLTSVVPYDVDDAKAKFAAAGVTQLTLTAPNVYGTTITDVLVSDLKAAGVTLKIKSVDFPTWLKDVYQNHDYELSLVDHVESHDFGNLWANPSYYFQYDNAQVQQLYQEAIASTSLDDEAAKLKQAAKIVAQDSASDWLFVATGRAAVGKKIQGWPTFNTNSRLNLVNLAVSK